MALIDNDPRKENDICHTPFENKRRETMNIRKQGYGFFKVAHEATPEIGCSKCSGILPANHIIVNGKHMHHFCFSK